MFHLYKRFKTEVVVPTTKVIKVSLRDLGLVIWISTVLAAAGAGDPIWDTGIERSSSFDSARLMRNYVWRRQTPF